MMSESKSNLEMGSDLSLEIEAEVSESFPIAAIGASAGGLEAFTQLLKNLPNDTGLGFVLIQHLAPEHDSQLSEILQRTTEMPVNEAQEGMRIVPNSVYVIPPNTLMTLEQGILRLEPRHRVRGKYMVIDGFFSSLAADRGEQAIAVLLSGNNEDGTVGLGVIKSAGGVTFAQDLASAEFPTMPMIAIASGHVDYVLAPAEIAAELVSISQKAHESREAVDVAIARDEIDEPSKAIFVNSGETLAHIFTLLLNRMGVDFSHYKQGTIRRRISRRMGLLNLRDLETYREFLQAHPDEVEKLYHDILINVTSFFRESDSFVALQQLVFPTVCQNKSIDTPIRIWVAGCSTGEEVYSIAMCLLEFLSDRPDKHPIQIFATDISEIAISKARLGIYSHESLVDISPERLRRFFTQVQDGYQIGKSVREVCVFARQNLTSDPPFSRLDLISCRNMLIYLEPVLQKKVMPIFHYALNPDGFLMLGSSEGVGSAADLFAIADKKNRIYKSKPTTPRLNFNFVKSAYVNESLSLLKRNVPEPESNLEQIADRVVLSQYAPVGVIVNVDLDILQFRGQTSQYLEPAAGKASLNLLKMARPELMLELRSILYDAKRQNVPVAKDDIEMSTLLVKINVIPIQSDNDPYFLVLFESRAKPILSPNPVPPPVSKSRKERQTEISIEVARLTHELFKTKEYLRSIIDAQEATNQDLKVASEEYLSSNEELQSANEELETAKEEIQATNEELSTINDEIRDRNNQLNFVNNDLQNLLKSVNIPILMLSGDLRIRRFTPMAEQAFNLITSDVGRPFSDIQTNIGVPNLMSLIIEVMDTLIPFEQDVQNRSGHWDILRIRPYRTTDNVIDGVVISLFDIDLLKHSVIELSFSRNYANAIIETLRQPLIVLDDYLQVVTANHAFYTVFQMSADLTEHQSLFDLGEGEWNIPKLRSLLNDILTLDVSVQDYEITQNFAQLGTRTMLLNACQIEQANQGKMILIAIEDITERKLQKQQLMAQNQALSEAIAASKAANQAKSKFLGNISHELRTPLNSIMGFSQLLQDNSSLDEEAKEFISIVYKSGEHLFALIKDLLDISKIEADKMELDPNLLDLANFLKTTMDMVWLKALQKNLTLIPDFAADLPETIFADEKRLRQVLINLLSNAIKFTSVGEINFTVRKIYSDNPNRKLIQFAISDTGAGIAAPELAKIFLPFEQVGEVAVKTEGTGLGLAISQDIINRMGGEINVVSQFGVGSIFSFELELSTPQIMGLSPLSILEMPPNPEARGLSPSPIPQTKNLLEAAEIPLTPSPSPKQVEKRIMSILVAEDVTYNQMLIKLFLQKLGYQPEIASNGLEVLAKLREERYDVILMDIQMPQMDGMETTRRIVAEYAEGDRPYIIAVSANSSSEDQAQYLALGMKAAISKPYVLDELEQALSRINL